MSGCFGLGCLLLPVCCRAASRRESGPNNIAEEQVAGQDHEYLYTGGNARVKSVTNRLRFTFHLSPFTLHLSRFTFHAEVPVAVPRPPLVRDFGPCSHPHRRTAGLPAERNPARGRCSPVGDRPCGRMRHPGRGSQRLPPARLRPPYSDRVRGGRQQHPRDLRELRAGSSPAAAPVRRYGPSRQPRLPLRFRDLPSATRGGCGLANPGGASGSTLAGHRQGRVDASDPTQPGALPRVDCPVRHRRSPGRRRREPAFMPPCCLGS